MPNRRRILLLNGPNLNMLGIREPGIYGSETLGDVEDLVKDTASELDFKVAALQSNHEGVLIDAIHDSRTNCQGIIINPGGLTHTSVSLRDALSAVALPVAEVHISDLSSRESFRQFSFIADVAQIHVIGEGVAGYARACRELIALIEEESEGKDS